MNPTLPSNSALLIRAWKTGVEEFNSGRFWHAHEFWEQGWVSLREPDKTYIQALIQVAAVLHLFGLGRKQPALALCASALRKFQSVRAEGKSLPFIEIEGAEHFLQLILVSKGEGWEQWVPSLRAKMSS